MKFALFVLVIDESIRSLESRRYSSSLSTESSEQSDRSFVDSSSTLIRLNKFVSNSGVCARREADKLIELGHITVNGKVVQTVGQKVPIDAEVKYKGRILCPEKLRYILLNKPRGYVSTVFDPEGRRTVLHLINRKYCPERIYPVGRLDYDSMGLLLLTNDGDLARKLSHPASEVEKFYHAKLEEPLKTEHLEDIRRGVSLDDGVAKVDRVTVLEEDPRHVGIAIHMGRNRVIRRIFNRLGYVVNSLDRVGYAHLTKQRVPRREWIFLNENDVQKLKALVSDVDVREGTSP